MLAAAAAALVLSAAAYFYFHRAPKLTDKDTIVLADFVNNTGDPDLRRHASPGPGHPTGTIAVSQNHG